MLQVVPDKRRVSREHGGRTGRLQASLRWTVWLEYLQPGSIPSPIYGVLTGMASDQKTGLAGCTEIFVPLTTPDYWRQATLITDSDSPDL